MSDNDAKMRERVLDIVEEALDRSTPDQDEFLREACGPEEKMLKEARDLLHRTRHRETLRVHAPPILELVGLDEEATPLSEVANEFPELISRLERTTARFERYRFPADEALGVGSSGRVELAYDQDLRRYVAVKFLHAADNDSKAAARFLQEAQILAQIDHPNIPPIYDLGVSPTGHLFFSMTLLSERTLADRLRRGALESADLLGFVRELLLVAEAVGLAHSCGVVHRDLKPANLVLGRHGGVQVADWGIARIANEGGSAGKRDQELVSDLSSARERAPILATSRGAQIGTPPYCAPELVDDRLPEPDERIDVYSLGAILYQAIGGAAPFTETGRALPSPRMLVERIRSERPRPLAGSPHQAPSALIAIVEKAMSHEPGDRYTDGTAMAEDLRAFLDQRVVRAYRTDAIARLGNWVRRNRAIAAAIALTIFVAAGFGLRNSLLAAARNRAVFRLSALQELDDLLEEAKTLWPASAANIPAYEAWLVRADTLVDQVPQHRALLGKLRADALPRSPEEERFDRTSHPSWSELEGLERELSTYQLEFDTIHGGPPPEPIPPYWLDEGVEAKSLSNLASALVNPRQVGREREALALIERALERTVDPSEGEVARLLRIRARALYYLGRHPEALTDVQEAAALDPDESTKLLGNLSAAIADAVLPETKLKTESMLADRRRRVEELRAAVVVRRTWRLDHQQDQWLHDQLTTLIERIESLRDDPRSPFSPAPDASSEEYGWSLPRRLAHARELADGFAPSGEHALAWKEALPAIRAAYPDLEIRAQVGLVPLGADPRSGLWEFFLLGSGSRPARDASGELQLEIESGLVFVLFDSVSTSVRTAEAGVEVTQRVTLAPYFLSKFEMTQHQWWVAEGTWPSHYHATSWVGQPRPTPRNPVEEVTWYRVDRQLRRMGLDLPTIAQWTYGARGGSTGSWSTGHDPAQLQRSANLRDVGFKGQPEHFHDWDDGYYMHAPVGKFEPNDFGLHDVHGNVWEWCRDWEAGPNDPLAGTEGLRLARHEDLKATRGGWFGSSAEAATLTTPGRRPPKSSFGGIGVRPMRRLDP